MYEVWFCCGPYSVIGCLLNHDLLMLTLPLLGGYVVQVDILKKKYNT